MKIDHYQLVVNHRIDGQWEWSAYLWVSPAFGADFVIKSAAPYPTEGICLSESKNILTALGIMNKNSKRRKTENPGAHQPRKSKKPKVAASAAEITRRSVKERGV